MNAMLPAGLDTEDLALRLRRHVVRMCAAGGSAQVDVTVTLTAVTLPPRFGGASDITTASCPLPELEPPLPQPTAMRATRPASAATAAGRTENATCIMVLPQQRPTREHSRRGRAQSTRKTNRRTPSSTARISVHKIEMKSRSTPPA